MRTPWIAAVALLLATPASAAPVITGVTAPNFVLPLRGGGELALDSLQGQPVVLNLWASWCAPCVHEMPLLDALHDRLDGVGVVVALNLDEQRAPAEALLVRDGLDLPVVWDEDRAAVTAWGPRKMPTTYIIDAAGLVVQRIEAGLSEEQIAEIEATVRGLARGEASAPDGPKPEATAASKPPESTPDGAEAPPDDATLHPWERGVLLSRIMGDPADPAAAAFDGHVDGAREAIAGAEAVSNDACGCN